jgi:damage-control phosphatase, subfamily I
MEPLQPYPHCVDCLMSLARQSADMAAGGNPALFEEAAAAAMEILQDSEGKGMSSPEIANEMLRVVSRVSGVSDPFARFKSQEMERAGHIMEGLGSVGRDLRSRVILSVLGNSLDFFKDPEHAMSQIPERIREGLSFSYDDVDRLDAFLSGRPGLVLYLTDNSGEIYFDIPLYEYLRERSGRTVLVVKGGPALNDLTRADLKHAGLEGSFDEVLDTGTDGAGIEWKRVSPSFLDLVGEADLILSKGMANFETVYPRDLALPVFFLFKVKCEPIQEYIKAPVESYVALWRDGTKM